MSVQTSRLPARQWQAVVQVIKVARVPARGDQQDTIGSLRCFSLHLDRSYEEIEEANLESEGLLLPQMKR